MSPFHVFAGHPGVAGPSTVIDLALSAPHTWECLPLVHHVRHSPDGFSWGYNGSGPSELARCMLIASLGDAAWCAVCGGKGWDKGCPGCSNAGFDRDFVESRYMQVRDRVVVRVPQDQPLAVTSRDVLYAAGLDREPA